MARGSENLCVGFETRRLLLRPFREEDAADLYEYGKDPRVGPSAGWPPHKSVEESLEIIRTVFSSPHVFAVTEQRSGKVIGSVGFVGRHRTELPGPDDELGYALHPGYWGHGLMTEAAERIVRYGFEELGLSTQWCRHYETNRRSGRVMEKCGFRYRFTELADVCLLKEKRIQLLYALTKEEWQAR